MGNFEPVVGFTKSVFYFWCFASWQV